MPPAILVQQDIARKTSTALFPKNWASHLFSNFPQNFSNGLCYRSYTNQCYISILFRRQQDNPSSRCEGTLIQRCEEKSAPVHGKERELALAPLFICLSLPGPVPCKLGQPGVLFVLPEVLTPVLGPFALFSQAFRFLVF